MKNTTPPYFVFVGLGNPGFQYEKTRHNIGFLVLKAFGERVGLQFKEDKHFNAYVAKGVVEGVLVHLVLPQTYMNLSGIALKRYLDYYKLETSHVVTVVDDVALAFGQIRLRLTGTSGGHNGLKSVEAQLGTTHYKRLRMGIGHQGQQQLADYVLAPFNKEENEQLEPFISRGVEVLQRLLKESMARVMNAINK